MVAKGARGLEGWEMGSGGRMTDHPLAWWPVVLSNEYQADLGSMMDWSVHQ